MQVIALNQQINHPKTYFKAESSVKSESKPSNLKKDEYISSKKEDNSSKKILKTIGGVLIAGALIAQFIYEIKSLRSDMKSTESAKKAADEFERFIDEITIVEFDPIENKAITLKEKCAMLLEKLKDSKVESNSLREKLTEISEKLTKSEVDSKMMKEDKSKLAERVKQLEEEIKKLIEAQKNTATIVEQKPKIINVAVSEVKETAVQGVKEEAVQEVAGTSKIDKLIENLKKLDEEVKKSNEDFAKSENLMLKISALSSTSGKVSGLASIVGYNPEKMFLMEKIVLPLKNNEVEKIPNMVLMYGPKGTGKTMMLNSIIEETGCNSISIATTFNDKENLELLRKVANQAIEEFNNTGKRTIIKMNEADCILNVADEEIAKEFSEIIENLSKNYKSTFIGTTNYPEKINSEFLKLSKVGTLYIPPVAKEDLPNLIKFYARNTQGEINYQELADIALSKVEAGGAYSNATIEAVLRKAANRNISFLNNEEIKLLTQKDLVDVFKKLEPDLTKEVLDSYKNIF